MTRFESPEGREPEEDTTPEEGQAFLGEGFDPDLLEGDDEDDEEPEEDEEGEAAPTAKAKSAGKDEEKPRDPPPPVPKRKVLESAFEWAFEGQEFIQPGLLDRFVDHAMLLLEANQEINLTAVTDPKEVAVKHYFDSWRLAQMMPLLGRRVLDLGTGPGFPGIPLALAEDAAKFTLCDSTGKKIDFVQKSIDALGLKNVTAVAERAEDNLINQNYDVVVARAVSSVRENVRTLRKVRHRLKDYVMYKGASWSREVRAGEREAERLGFHLDTVWEYELPGEMGKRALLVYRAPGGQGT